jgi:Flp pilus assembly pilin Flp
MKELLRRLWKDEEGAEIAEWVIVVALLVFVGSAIYFGILQGQLSDAVNTIGDNIQELASGNEL